MKTNSGGNEPEPDGCNINNAELMGMLMDTALNGSPHQVCEISASQSFMVPLWTAMWDADNHEDEKK
jgi:hypothetical protein